MFYQNEYEMSVFNLEEADVEDQRQRSQLFEREARRMIEKRLPIPAYDHLLKVRPAMVRPLPELLLLTDREPFG